jgi:hypothetical protein
MLPYATFAKVNMSLVLQSSRISIKNKNYIAIGGIMDFFKIQIREETVHHKYYWPWA